VFRRLPDYQRERIAFTFDGRPLSAMKGDTLAAALLSAAVMTFRTTPVSGSPRGPYCMMGVCFECLVSVDGRSNQQACVVMVEEGMRVETQRGAASYTGGEDA
jgi:predicted molibdopterin-dependent oxidoreductase YjgC